ncbi:MAG: pilus assembly protein TadG-related protein [bacterium]|nr:pilus assembly protein TadG-related protein [bacterium]
MLQKLKRDENGQSLVAGALVMLIIVAFLATSMDIGKFVNWRIKTQTASDAACVSGAKMEAAWLNWIALLNLGILGGWRTIASGFALLPDPKTFFQGVRLIRAGAQLTRELGRLQDRIASIISPVLTLNRVNTIARANGADRGLCTDEERILLPRLKIDSNGRSRIWVIFATAWWIVMRGDDPPEHLGVVARKTVTRDLWTEQILRANMGPINAFAQATVTPEDNPWWAEWMLWPGFDAKLEPLRDDVGEAIENQLILLGGIFDLNSIGAIKILQPQH